MITVSCLGKFHSLALAEQLDKNQMLSKLYIGYYSKANPLVRKLGGYEDRELIPLGKVKTFPVCAVLNRFTRKYYEMSEAFDYLVANRINNWDVFSSRVFIGWSSMSNHSLLAAKKRKMFTISERGSTHILEQRRILQEEYSKVGLPFKFDDRIVKKELAEYALADYISIPTNFVKQTFLNQGVSEKKLIVNPYGVDLKLFNTVKRPTDQPFRVLYLGDLIIRKGVQYLFDAIKKISDANIEFWFIGKIHPEVKELVSAMKLKNVVFFGQIPFYELTAYIQKCSVAVLPSLEEGFSRVIPQLMACGLPVITTPNSGAEEIIKDGVNGYITPIRDSNLITERIENLFKNRNILTKMSALAEISVKEGFTWDDYGNRYIKFIKTHL